MLVQPIDPEGLKMSYNFSVEMPGVIEYFGTRFAVETETWLKALRRAQKSQLELEFCKGEKLLRNTDSLIGMYRRKMGEQLKQRCHDEFQAIVEPLGDNLKKVDPADFLDVTQKAHDFLYAVRYQTKTHSPVHRHAKSLLCSKIYDSPSSPKIKFFQSLLIF